MKQTAWTKADVLHCSGDTLDGTEHATRAAQLHRPAFRMHASNAVADCNCGLRANYSGKADRRVPRHMVLSLGKFYLLKASYIKSENLKFNLSHFDSFSLDK